VLNLLEYPGPINSLINWISVFPVIVEIIRISSRFCFRDRWVKIQDFIAASFTLHIVIIPVFANLPCNNIVLKFVLPCVPLIALALLLVIVKPIIKVANCVQIDGNFQIVDADAFRNLRGLEKAIALVKMLEMNEFRLFEEWFESSVNDVIQVQDFDFIGVTSSLLLICLIHFRFVRTSHNSSITLQD
jgi:hypothetical protein